MRARTIQATYGMYERGRRIGLWRLQVRAVILGEGVHKANLRSMKAISALQASLLGRNPLMKAKERTKKRRRRCP